MLRRPGRNSVWKWGQTSRDHMNDVRIVAPCSEPVPLFNGLCSVNRLLQDEIHAELGLSARSAIYHKSMISNGLQIFYDRIRRNLKKNWFFWKKPVNHLANSYVLSETPFSLSRTRLFPVSYTC